MKIDRRQALSLLPIGLAAACSRQDAASRLSPLDRLQALVDAPSGQRVPAAGFVLIQDGEVLASEAVGQARGLSAEESTLGVETAPFSINAPFRAASISKLAVALLCAGLAADGAIDLDTDVRQWGVPLPLPPELSLAILTPRALLSHISGLKDPDAYWQAHPGTLAHLLQSQVPGISSSKPNWFHYSNLNYGILATALETKTQTRFDHLIADYVLTPLGIDAGFNWAGVSPDKRKSGATLYREDETGWQIQIDGPETLTSNAPLLLMSPGAEDVPYMPGQNGTLFSPQGGLRANLLDLAHLVDRIAREPVLTNPVWTANDDGSNGDTEGGYFTGYGTGVHLYDAPSSFWPGVALAGHHGEAYGLYAGAWHASALNLSFAYAVTGTPQAGPGQADHPALNAFTYPLVQAVQDAYIASAAAT